MQMTTHIRHATRQNTNGRRIAIGLGVLSSMTAVQLLIAYGHSMLY